MAVFADVTTDGTWIAVAIAGLSMIGGTLSAVVALFQLVVNKKYDLKLSKLESDMSDCNARHEECEEQHAVTRAELKKKDAELTARDVRDRADLQAQINDLKRINGMAVGTGEHQAHKDEK